MKPGRNTRACRGKRGRKIDTDENIIRSGTDGQRDDPHRRAGVQHNISQSEQGSWRSRYLSGVLKLAPHLTVAENIFIDRLSGKKTGDRLAKFEKQAGELLDKLGFGDIDAGMPVADLPVALQQIGNLQITGKNEKILVLTNRRRTHLQRN